MTDFNGANPNITFDFEKKVYLYELELFVVQVIDHFVNKREQQFYD